MEALRAIVPPPVKPAEVPAKPSWEIVEDEIGTPLPPDFKEYVGAFGTGCFDRFLWVLSPFSSNPNLQLVPRLKRELAALRVLKAEDSEEIPYEVYPTPGGLLLWGVTDNGDGLYWHTIGSPDQWTVVVNAGRDPECEEFPLSMSEFLAGILSLRVKSTIFPDDFPAQTPRFYPLVGWLGA